MPQMMPGTDFPVWKFKKRGGAKAFRIDRARQAEARADREEEKNRIGGVVLRGDGIGYTASQANSRSSVTHHPIQLTWSANPPQDHRLGTLRQAKSRLALDQAAYTDWIALRDTHPATPSRSPLSLRSYALQAAADAWGRPYFFYDLPVELAFAIPDLLPAVHLRVAAVAKPGTRAHLPFQVWANVAASFGSAVPGRWRTYKGLVLADGKEFGVLTVMNENAGQEWAGMVAEEAGRKAREGRRYRPRELEMPTFFLTILDLSGDETFTNDDVHKIKAVAKTLAVLQLDGTLLTDEGLRWVTSSIGDEGAYTRLEVLTLSRTKVSNAGVVKLGRLSSLRMLDLRQTRCNATITPLLYRAATKSRPGEDIRSFRPARHRQELDELDESAPTICDHVEADTELMLFGGSYSPACVLTHLRLLAQLEAGLDPSAARWNKPVCVHVDGVVRAVDEHLVSNDSLFGHLGALSGRANALHRSEFGVVTSTSSLSRDAMNDEVLEAGKRTTVFSVRKDEVAGGLYEGQGKTGGRATRLEGRARFRAFRAPDELPLLSDSEDEIDGLGNAGQELDRVPTLHGLLEVFRTGGLRPREVAVAEESKLMLLRHLPCPDPFDPVPVGELVPDSGGRGVQGNMPAVRRIVEGDTLAKKKPKVTDGSFLSFIPQARADSQPSPPLTRPSPFRQPHQLSSSLPPSSFASSPRPVSLPPATPPSSYLAATPRASGGHRPGKLANRFAAPAQSGAKARQAAMVKPAVVAGRTPIPAPLPSGQKKPLFQQSFH